MSEARSAVPTVECEGGRDDVGFKYGVRAMGAIQAVYEWRMGVITRNSDRAEEYVLRQADEYRSAVEREVPELLEEVEGLGRGSQLGFRRAFFLQVATEVGLGMGVGCSAIGMSSGRGGSVIGQNWDQPQAAAGKQVVLTLRVRAQLPVLMFGHAGAIGYIGLNAAGLGHVGNQLYRTEGTAGLPHYFINRKLLEFSTVEEAIAWLHAITPASSCNYLIGDATGGLVDVELGAGFAHVLPRARRLAHTNHYLSELNQPYDQYRTVLPDSEARMTALRLAFLNGTDPADLEAALRDHSGYPTSICRHEAGDGLTSRASIVMRLDEREMLLASGPPCVTEYQSYRLEPQ